ncbi:hypothetical protein EVA_14869 [gut metagenome]|uniref:Uncharacterized protein n=1 Tax=gut metagenome TaxID=749906 RepID=J9CAX1_9ZZZZ
MSNYPLIWYFTKNYARKQEPELIFLLSTTLHLLLFPKNQ